MNTSKWFLEVVQDSDGTYYANLNIGGKLVEGLPRNVSYRALQDAIRKQTGIEILKKKDMQFEARDGKKFAYVDNTEVRKDCRVSLRELDGHWYPKFETPVTGDKVYIYPHANHYQDFDSPCILEGTVVGRKPALQIEGVPWVATMKIHEEGRIYRDGSVEPLDRVQDYYDKGNSMYVHSLEEAQEKARVVYEKIDMIKALPRMENPAGPYVTDYFKAVNIKALTDDQLLVARDLARDFKMSVPGLKDEMVRRFERNVRTPLEELISDARSKAFLTKASQTKECNIKQEMER